MTRHAIATFAGLEPPSTAKAWGTVLVAAAVLLGTETISSATDAESRCQAGRYKAAGTYAQCQHKARALLFATDSGRFVEALAKCTARYAATWPKLQLRAQGSGATCETVRFVDNGDGTVSDGLTGLQWEKKEDLDSIPDPGNRHDADNTYTWSAGGAGFTASDGTAFTDFIATLDGTCFAGQCDWRLPTSAELQTILSASYPLCDLSPCISSVFGPTATSPYWTSTARTYDSFSALYAEVVSFVSGYVANAQKDDALPVRAVRGGL